MGIWLTQTIEMNRSCVGRTPGPRGTPSSRRRRRSLGLRAGEGARYGGKSRSENSEIIEFLNCFYLTLYLNANCKRISRPLNSCGNGGNGTDALIPATAARSNDSLPDGIAITSFGTCPLWLITN